MSHRPERRYLSQIKAHTGPQQGVRKEDYETVLVLGRRS
jgi:hypothetical protein